VRFARILVVFLSAWSFGSAAPRAADADLCARAIARSEAASDLPGGLLTAVAASESGRYDRGRRQVAPWPWTVNNAGDGRYFATKEEAVDHVLRLKAAGERNIDVGCMQINLMHHPEAFASLEEAFEPSRNVAYGARFLGALERETASWERAVERYHTADPERGRAYRERVYRRWAQAAPGEPGLEPAMPRVVAASLDRDRPLADGLAHRSSERRKLRPLSGRGFVSLTSAPSGVAVLRPSADRRLKPIVRPLRRPSVGLVRLTSSHRTVIALAP
jgi:Transglycosylase SLT domain